MAKQGAVVQLWQQRCSCGSNCESCYGAGHVQFPPTIKAEGVTYMVLIGGLHGKQSSCCSACCTAALCSSHRLLGLQPVLYVDPRFAVKIDVSQYECIKVHHRTGAYPCTAGPLSSTGNDAALHHTYELMHAHTASCTACLV